MEKKEGEDTIHTENSSNSILKRALLDKKSKIYLNKNVKTIERYLKDKGIHIGHDDIKGFLLTQKSAAQISTNSSRRKIAEVSKSFTGRQSFFAQVHSDVVVLSKKRSYNSGEYLILTLVEQLTNYVYLEKVKSTSFNHISAAFQRIFKRSPYLPEKCDKIISDNGVEFVSTKIRKFMEDVGIKMNYVQIRPGRGSKGSGIAEVLNRRLRRHLEAQITESYEKKPLRIVLESVEQIMNSESQGCLDNMSATEALTQDPKYISMVKSSNRFKKRKYLRQQMNNKDRIPLYSIVKIKTFTDKKVFEKKESYGVITDGLFIVIDISNDNFVDHYKVANLFSLKPIATCTYTFNELVMVPIGYARACYVESVTNIGPILRVLPNDLIEYQTKNDDTTFIGPIDIKK